MGTLDDTIRATSFEVIKFEGATTAGTVEASDLSWLLVGQEQIMLEVGSGYTAGSVTIGSTLGPVDRATVIGGDNYAVYNVSGTEVWVSDDI